MSKNFELLQRVAKNDIFNLTEEPVQPPEMAPPSTPLKNVAQERVTPRYLSKKASPDPEITKLVQRLFSQAGEGGGPKVVTFSGMEHDDRSSWICARAGEVLAEQADKTVCMVDANFVSPQLHDHLSADNHGGLSEALATKGPINNFAMPVSRENLWLIPAGLVKAGCHPSIERYRERFAELREAFDYILISSPAVSSETESTFLGQLADGVILIVEANHSRRETVRRAKERLESAHVRLLGAVLDQRTFPIPEKLYQKL